MSATIATDQLQVGMFIHLDLKWWEHPFALSSFEINAAEQIQALRQLGLQRVRWSPDKSRTAAAMARPASGAASPGAHSGASPGTSPQPAPVESADAGIGATAASATHASAETAAPQDAVAERRAADRLCQQQYAEVGQAWHDLVAQVHSAPTGAKLACEGLSRALLAKMALQGEVCVRTVAAGLGEGPSAHATNVAVVSLLLGRAFGLPAAEMMDIGVGALLHDIGEEALTARLRLADLQGSAIDQARWREHVALGVLAGQRMGLSSGALLVIGQHHERADGGGFPLGLGLDRMTAAARIVALVDHFDTLCNPSDATPGATPHEALSLLFAQARSQFDGAMLHAFIRMMGVYPPGSLVQLTDDRFGLVVACNSSRPLKPRVLVCDAAVPADEAVPLNLEALPDLGVRRSLKAAQLPPQVLAYLAPSPRVAYYFEPAAAPVGVQQALPETVA